MNNYMTSKDKATEYGYEVLVNILKIIIHRMLILNILDYREPST